MKAFANLYFPAAIALFAIPAWSASKVTFYRDVLPILQKNCQSCHRPGEAGPMPLLSYRDVQPMASAVKDAVLTKRMPPWRADPNFGKFLNDRSLAAEDAKTLLAWIDKGAPEGNPQDGPAPLTFAAGWKIGKPDLILITPQSAALATTEPADYTYCIIPTGFTEDRWVERAELRPQNRTIVRNAVAFIREPGSNWLKDAKPGEVFLPKQHAVSNTASAQTIGFGGDVLASYAPGVSSAEMRPGQARLIKAGSDIVLQLHYSADVNEPSAASLGIIFASHAPSERVYTIAAARGDFTIPAGASNKEVESKVTLGRSARIVSLLPLMHSRGKSFRYDATYPDGRTETLLSVPRYDTHWQVAYQVAGQPLFPPGTEIRCKAVFDNSGNNPSNPDANLEVRYGEQSAEEMMIGFIEISFDAKLDPAELLRPPAAGE